MISTKSFLGWKRLTRVGEKRKEGEDELVVCHLSNLVHLGAGGSPGVVGGGIANLCLDIRVALCVVFGHAESTLAKMLYGHDGSGRVRDRWLSFSGKKAHELCSRSCRESPRHWPLTSHNPPGASLRTVRRGSRPRASTHQTRALELCIKQRDYNTLVVKRLSSLPSKQGAGVRLPPSVFFPVSTYSQLFQSVESRSGPVYVNYTPIAIIT